MTFSLSDLLAVRPRVAQLGTVIGINYFTYNTFDKVTVHVDIRTLNVETVIRKRQPSISSC